MFRNMRGFGSNWDQNSQKTPHGQKGTTRTETRSQEKDNTQYQEILNNLVSATDL